MVGPTAHPSRTNRLLLATLKSGLAVILLLSPTLFGQSGAGSVQGVVRDSSRAVIPGAKVSTQHTTTSVERKTTANELGFFVVPGLQPGAYKVTVGP
jgi:Carboxypeptidase regulatory-like domain